MARIAVKSMKPPFVLRSVFVVLIVIEFGECCILGGSLAIILRSWHKPAVGGLCEVLNEERPGQWFVKPFFSVQSADGYLAPDKDLRPIRDTPGTDETLSWLDVPSQTEVSV